MLVGTSVGRRDEGTLVGRDVGTLVGIEVGTLVGIDVGTLVGMLVGRLVGSDVGVEVGLAALPEDDEPEDAPEVACRAGVLVAVGVPGVPLFPGDAGVPGVLGRATFLLFASAGGAAGPGEGSAGASAKPRG
jgi:hypothetical protein